MVQQDGPGAGAGDGAGCRCQCSLLSHDAGAGLLPNLLLLLVRATSYIVCLVSAAQGMLEVHGIIAKQ